MSIAIAGFLFAIEVFVLDGWWLFLFSFAVPLAIVVSGKGNQSPRVVLQDKRGMRQLAAWGLIFLLLVGSTLANEALAEKRGREIATACRQYRQHSGHFPAQLSDLVPGYLSAIPPGKLVVGSRWRYRAPHSEATDLFPGLYLDSRTYSGWRSFDFATDTLQTGPAW